MTHDIFGTPMAESQAEADRQVAEIDAREAVTDQAGAGNYVVTTTTDESGAVYVGGPVEIYAAASLTTAAEFIRGAIVNGKRGPGCFSVNDSEGRQWSPDPYAEYDPRLVFLGPIRRRGRVVEVREATR